MDYGLLEVLSTFQGRPAGDPFLCVTYRITNEHPEDNKMLFGTSPRRP